LLLSAGAIANQKNDILINNPGNKINSHKSDSISPEFPFESKYIDVLNSTLHFLEIGKGEPVLFLHGMPTNVYIWRNVIPQVTQNNRAIALDLIGFGKSGKPAIDYTFNEHLEYLSAFIEKMELNNITLVVHDLGSMAGLHYAMDHPEKIKAIVMMESVILPSEVFYKNSTMMLKMMFGMLHKNEKMANKMVIKRNKMVTMAIPMWTKRKLSDVEMNY